MEILLLIINALDINEKYFHYFVLHITKLYTYLCNRNHKNIIKWKLTKSKTIGITPT